MCLQRQTCRLNHHTIQLNINVHGIGRNGSRSSILSSGESPDAQSRVLPIALHNREIAYIMAATSTIFPKRYANVITRHEQNKTILSHATSIGIFFK